MKTRHVLTSLVAVALGAGAVLIALNVSHAPLARSALRARSGQSFSPISVTFSSPNNGWVLGTARCASSRTCLALRKSTNAGRTWSVVSLSPSLLGIADSPVAGATSATAQGASLHVQFADARNGWIYGSLVVPVSTTSAYGILRPALWSTHDGGLLWLRQRLAWIEGGNPVLAVGASHGTVYLMAMNRESTVTVEKSPVGSDAWRESKAGLLQGPAGGAEMGGAFVFEGSSGWLIEGNDRGVSGSARFVNNGPWSAWTPPCNSVGDSFAVPATSTAQNLVVVCTMGGFAYQLSKAAPRGATLGSSWLYFSHNGGRSFLPGPELKPVKSFRYFSNSVLASPKPGVLFVNRPVGSGTSEELVASFDGGVHWVTVYAGWPTYLQFASATKGVGIIQSTGSQTMIMTSDGGRHWKPVRF